MRLRDEMLVDRGSFYHFRSLDASIRSGSGYFPFVPTMFYLRVSLR